VAGAQPTPNGWEGVRANRETAIMSVEVVTTGAAIGAEIRGVDLAQPLDDAAFDVIETAFDEHGVIIFRDQKITPAQQVAFSAHFGEVEINHNGSKYGIAGNPEIYIISNITENGRPIGTRRAGGTWHSDMCYAERPARATMLYAAEVPELYGLSLGDTAFANAAAAWDALPEPMKHRIDGLEAVFDFRGRKRSRPIKDETVAQYPPVKHPMVRTHPRTGRKSLYVMRDDCTAVVDMEPDEAQALIAALADHIVRPEFVYRHRWRRGDLVIWDNCTAQHKAIFDYDLPQRRLMWRTTIKGGVPA
jgi:taurine dioxygenase